MILTISLLVMLLSLLYLLPLAEIFPQRHMQRTFNQILSRDESVRISSSTSKLFEILDPLIIWMINLFQIDGYAPRWSQYRNKIKLANADHYFNVTYFVGLKYLLSSLLFLYFVVLNIASFSLELSLLGIIVTFLGFVLPDQWLAIRIKKRRWEIQRQIPSVLISLSVTTDAGLSLMQAIEEVCNRKSGELCLELRRTLDEIAVGIPQKEAFENLIDRVLVEELTLMVSAIIQTLEKGAAGMTKVLREQANAAWSKRKSRAKELGEKASIKLFLPLMGFILPSLLIFIISPSIFTLIRFFDF